MKANAMSEAEGEVSEDATLGNESAETPQIGGEEDRIVIEYGHIPSSLDETLLAFGRDLVKNSNYF